MGAVCGCFADKTDYEAEVNLYHFHLHRAVGKGTFGKVRVVEHKKTKKLYALKYVDKARCIKQKAVANVIQERRLLEEVDHSFIVNLRYAFQDDMNCFFVLDLMLGGDLRFHLDRKGPVAENVVMFWTAELASALQYLHKQHIVHRDIKPDNILLDAAGHAHLTDFNVAIHYSENRMHTSVAGSMAYMAPEVVGRKGYTWRIDWWSLGVMAYELLFNRRPFDGRTSEKMTRSILNDKLAFPEDAKTRCSPQCISALKAFIKRDSSLRLGCQLNRKGVNDVRDHPWFASINWDNLEEKEVPPPFTPDSEKPNFDVTHELDEFLMVEKPLSHSKRKMNVDPNKLKPELRELEEKFTVYDFSSSKRVSYYPNNQPVESLCKAMSDIEHLESPPSSADTLVPTYTIAERSLANTPSDDICPPVPSLSNKLKS